ncbi:glutathione S-transferase TAU 19 [Perilla frutescens var. hirtella]|nr:glutathione S-transferase TAU 19 [Perilla frutescens var. hirtella]
MEHEEEEVMVLGFWTSPYVMRVKIALEEKGIKFVYKEENLFHEKSLLLLEANPVHKKVPVLIHKGRPICESLVILQYIDQVWNHNSFTILPQHPYDRARPRFFIDFFDKMIHDVGRRMWASKGEDQECARQEFLERLKYLEAELGDSPYFGGEEFGVLDIALIPFSCRFYTYERLCKFSVEEKCPKLKEWVRRCSERESVSKVLPHHQDVYAFVLEQRKTLGLTN